MFFDLHRDFIAVPFKWKSKEPSVRNTFLKKYIDKIVYTKNNINPDEPMLEIHYTEIVNQAIEVYKQYRQEMKIRLEERKQKAIADGTYWGLAGTDKYVNDK